MAGFSARELLLILRAQNQASGALRRVSSDLRSMGRLRDLQLRQQKIAIQQQGLLKQRQRALRELQSLEGGARAIGLERTRLNNMLREEDLTYRLARARRSLARMKPSTQAFADQAHYVRQLEGRLGSLGVSMQHLDARAASNRLRMGELSSEMRILGSRSQVLARQMLDVNKAIRDARWERLALAGRTLGHLGRVAQLAGLGLAAGVGYAANAAADFGRGATLVATQTGRINTGFQTVVRNSRVLQEAMLSVLGDSQASVEDLTQATYDLFSSLDSAHKGFLTLADGVKLLRLTNKAAVAGQTDLSTATEAAIRTMNTFNVPISKMPQTFQRMFAAVRFGEMTFAQFATSLQTTAPAARAAGQSFDTLAGTMAFLTRRLGVSKAQVGFARLTEIFARKKFIEGLEKFNVDITDANGHLKQMPQIIDTLVQRFPKLAKGGTFLQQFIREMSGTEGTIQARRAFVFLAQNAEAYGNMVNRVSDDNKEFTRSLGAMEQTTGVRWQKFMNRMRVLFIRLGDAALPTILKIVEPFEKLVDWFSKLDKGTRENIGSWLAWGAAILLVGGSIAALVGGLASVLGSLGRLGIMFPTLVATAIAMGVAVKALTGDWHGLGDALKNVATWSTDSARNFAIASAIMVASMFRLRRAATSAGLAMTASGIGSFLGFGTARGAARGGRAAAGARLIRMTTAQSGRMAGMLKAAGVAAALLPGPLKVAAVAMGGVAGLGLLLQHRQEAAARAAEMNARATERLQRAMRAPAEAAASFGRFATSLRDVRRSRLDIQDMNAQIRQLKRNMEDATGATRAQMGRDLQRLILDRADAYDAMGAAAEKAQVQLLGFNRFLAGQDVLLTKLDRKQQALKNLQDFVRESRRGDFDAGDFDPQAVHQAVQQIARLQNEITKIQTNFKSATTGMTNNFIGFVRTLQQQKLLPKDIGLGAIQDALTLMVRQRKVMTLPQLKLFFDAYINPRSMAKLPGQIQAFIKRQRRNRVEVEATIKLARQRATLQEEIMQGRAGRAVQLSAEVRVDRAKSQVNSLHSWIKANSKLPPFKAFIQPGGASLGADLKAGILAGSQSLASSLSASLIAQIDAAIAAARAHMRATSPSKLTATKIGKPFTQGILLGMLKTMAGVQGKKMTKDTIKTLVDTWEDALKTGTEKILDTFRGFRDSLRDQFFGNIGELNELRMEWGLALNVPELTQNLRDSNKDLNGFFKDLNRLQKRHVPKALLLQLSQMGEEGAAIIDALASSSGKDLKAYVQAWKRSQKLLNKVALEQTRIQVRQWRRLGRAMAFGIIQGIRDEEPGLYRFFRRMFLNLFRNAQNANKSHSPSKLYMKEGQNIVQGLALGLAQGRGMMVPMPGVGANKAFLARGGGTVGAINVYAQKDESLMATLEKMRFRLKNQMR